MSRASDLMTTDLVTVRPEMSLLQVQHLFVVLQISGAPVVDVRGDVVGVISSSDLLRAVDQICDEDVDPMPPDDDGLPERLGVLSVRDVATSEAVWVAPDAPIQDVATLMRTEGIHRVLVGAESRLEGILTAFDLLEALEE
jgi:CBS domain-containing protein